MAKEDIDKIIAAFKAMSQEAMEEATEVVEETPWSTPYVPTKAKRPAPPKFPYGERSLESFPDARKVKKTADALIGTVSKLSELDSEFTELRNSAEQKISELKEREGYSDLEKRKAEEVDKIGGEILEAMGDSKDILYKHGNTLMAVYNVMENPKGMSVDKKQILLDTLKKYVSEDIAGNILKEAADAEKAAMESMKVLKNRLAVWDVPKGLEKKVKQVGTSSKKMSGIKEFLSGLWQGFKNALSSVGDKLSSLLSSAQQADPLIDDMNAALAEAGISTSSKKIADLESGVENLDPFEKKIYDMCVENNMSKEDAFEVIINTVDGDVSQLSDEIRDYAENNNLIN